MEYRRSSEVGPLAQASMNRRACRRAACLLLASLALSTGVAETTAGWQPPAEIAAAAERHIDTIAGETTGELIATAGFLDPRLKLRRCSEDLEAFVSPGARLAGRVIVGVRCAGEPPWKIYMPVQVGIMENVVVTTRPLPRDHVIKPEDVSTVRRDVANLTSGYVRASDEVVGLRIARPVHQGIVLQPRMLRQLPLVEKGQRVTLSVTSETLRIQMPGIAESDGRTDDLIQVRNLSSGRLIEGRVRSAGLVEVAIN